MDLTLRGTKGKTQPVVDNSNTSSLRNDNNTVRHTEDDGVPSACGGKSLQLPCEARVVAPRYEEQMQDLQRDFANLNPKSPISPPNIDVNYERNGPFHSPDQLDGKPRHMAHLMTAGPQLDARCDPRAIPHNVTKACHPSDTSTATQPSDSINQRGLTSPPVKQQSLVQVVSGQPSSSASVVEQLRQLAGAGNHSEAWKKDLIQKLIRQYEKTKAKRCVPVSPDTDMESTLVGQKEKQFRVQVVPEEKPEDMIIISDDNDTFLDIRHESKPGLGIVQPHQELRPLNCQPSSADILDVHPSRIPYGHLNRDNFLRHYEFLKGYVLPGTQQSLAHLLNVYSTQPAELAVGCHGILLTQNNRPTEQGEYHEVDPIVIGTKGHQYIKLAGQGSYGSVKLCRDNCTKVEFVKKEILKTNGVILYEVKILSELNHQNIAGLYGFILRNGVPEILMEYAGVSLIEYTVKPSSPDDLREDKIIDMTYQGLSGLEYLDQKGIIHYDIKPENLCVLKTQNKIQLKITDFGSAKRMSEPPDFMGCTVEYLSPELGIQLVSAKYQSGLQSLFMFDTSDYVVTTKSDIFSLALSIMFVYRKGHVVISLFNNGQMNYNGLDQAAMNKLRQTILVSLVKNPASVKTFLIPDACCSEMKSILREMVEEIPGKRKSATELKDLMDDVLNRRKLPAEVPVFLSYVSYNEDRHVSLTRQLSSRNSAVLVPSNTGPVRNNENRRRSRDQSSLPYGYTGHQKMDTSVEDIEVVSHLQGVVPKFSQF